MVIHAETEEIWMTLATAFALTEALASIGTLTDEETLRIRRTASPRRREQTMLSISEPRRSTTVQSPHLVRQKDWVFVAVLVVFRSRSRVRGRWWGPRGRH